MGQKSRELYPIGTNLYDGLLFNRNCTVDRQTDEVIQGNMVVSDIIPVSTDYQYTRSYRLYGVFNYDENHDYLGYQAGINNLSSSVISPLIAGTKYIRTIIHPAYINSNGYVIATGCWLKRTA